MLIIVETFFEICHIDFKDGSINLRKQMKQPAKHQNLGIAPLSCFFSILHICVLI